MTMQVEGYRDYLADVGHRRAVIAAYAETCRLLKEFAEWAGPGRTPLKLGTLVLDAANSVGRLDLDIKPRLVVLGTEAQLSAPEWRAHESKLSQQHGITLRTIRTDAYRLDSP